MSADRIVAVGLLTEEDLERLGDDFKRYFPVPMEDPCFTDLLAAIDEADRAMARERKTDAEPGSAADVPNGSGILAGRTQTPLPSVDGS